MATMGFLDKTFKMSVLNSVPAGLDESLLAAVNSKDAHAIDDIFRMFTQTEKEDKMPYICKSNDDLTQAAFILRVLEVGRDLGNWFKISVGADGTVSWSKQPLYDMSFEDNLLRRITHISGVTHTVAKDVYINTNFVMQNGMSDRDAVLVNGSTSVKINKLFNEGEGPNEYTLDDKGSHMLELVKEAKSKLEAHHKAVTDAKGKRIRQIAIEDETKKRRVDALAIAHSARANADKTFTRAWSFSPDDKA